MPTRFNKIATERPSRRGGRGCLRWRRLVAPVVLVLLLFGCTTDLHIYTAASFKSIPRDGSVVMVRSNEPAVANMAKVWLEKRGVLVVIALHDTGRDEDLCPGCSREQATFEEARLARASQVIFAEAARFNQPIQLVVSLRALSVQTEEEAWQAVAREQLSSHVWGDEARTRMGLLTCHALATAWRYRPAGYAISSALDQCELHE